MKVTTFAVVSLFMFTAFQTIIGGINPYKDYDVEYMNEFWDSSDSHLYTKRTTASMQSVEIADMIISNDEIYLLRYWEPVKIEKSSMDWTENPYDDWTWQFYYHSLRMVSYLVSSYEFTGEMKYLEEAKWYIESWIEYNPSYRKQASERAWDDHSTANRISTFIQFWDSYHNSPLQDEEFSVLFLNILRIHGEFTADSDNYYWGHNHGIYQDRSLLQLSVLFPNYDESPYWYEVANMRLSKHLKEDLTDSGVHKEHSPSYHFLVLNLFMSIDEFNKNYQLINSELDSKIYQMQDYLAYIIKPDGTLPLVGDSALENVLRIKENQIVNENLLYLKTEGRKGTGFDNYCTGYLDAGVGIDKSGIFDDENHYFAIFSAFHSSVHKQSDDLSFVLSYDETDYFVDSGKYNFDESDKFRKYIRSTFAHNTIIVDGESYDYRDLENVDKSNLYNFSCSDNYSIFQSKHTLYEGVEINRNVIIIYDKGIFIHDTISSINEHQYQQVFNIGKDVSINYNQSSLLRFNSTKDNSSIYLRQLVEYSSMEIFTGSEEPVRGWMSETFNQVIPISTVVYSTSGSDVQFQTQIGFGVSGFNVTVVSSDSVTNSYVINNDDGSQLILDLN